MKPIKKSKLKDQCYYLGDGRNANVGLWVKEKDCFLTIGCKFGNWLIKYEPYEKGNLCFVPFKELIKEGEDENKRNRKKI